ncbi:hypothetical protein FEM48_Zijuj04G0195100 [Ziziphus jujuba var. spinosa]|uniref:CCHC-type domain-containing protein n=1 Tax=Ziziphus jujuba var. spinosa TaxID=714518 RepID=A0A978VLR8_ZIZJJ|nr:hypothetical protein FEM48_Zijuj04G0195100 [Ziziphus jujuba var. spinosa]
MECTDAQKVTCAVYMLKQGASHWWEMISRAWDVQRNPITLVRFKVKARYAPHLVDTDERKAQKFERGLMDGLRRPISVLRLQTYGEVLQRAQILENDDEMSMKAESKKRVKNEQFGKMEYPTCETCRKKHPGECYRKTGACFKCGKHGHLFKNCPNVGNATQKVKRDQLTQGCVYVLIRHDAEVSPSMVAALHVNLI